MIQLLYPRDKRLPYFIIIAIYALYVAAFAAYHSQLGIGLSALAIVPVIGAGWYFGVPGGLVTACLAILANLVILSFGPQLYIDPLRYPSSWLGMLALFVVAFLFGKLSAITQEHRQAIFTLKQYEQEREAHTHFLERLNQVTGMALEANNLDSTLSILVERIGKLFHADDCYFSRWDEAAGVPIPVMAHGSLREAYPQIQFDAQEPSLTAAVLEAQHVLAVEDISNSPYISARVASLFPNRSMLALPMIVQRRRLGALLLGYQEARSFPQEDLIHAELTAEQMSVVLSKSLSLEEERKQVKQLTALHDIALISIDVDSEDELIRRVTDVIGQNLYTDNFGILLVDEQAGLLRTHPSYRFFSTEQPPVSCIPLTAGVSGQVVQTGQALRIGNVQGIQEYVNVDQRTVSELCVPIKFRGRVLGVINAESTRPDAFTQEDERMLTTMAGQIATALEQIHKTRDERNLLDQLAHSRDLTYALAHITTHIEKAFTIEDIIENLGKELSRINLTCIVAVYDQTTKLFTINYSSIEPQSLEQLESKLGHPLLQHKFSAQQLSPEALLYPSVLPEPAEEIRRLFPSTHGAEMTQILAQIGLTNTMETLRLLLTFEETLLGVLWVWGKDLSRADLPILSIFAKQVGISLERARLFQEVQSLALTDPLTELHNRRSIFELGKVEFSRALRMKREFSCMMLDLDHFKQINDTYGHPVGDQVLREFAVRCKRSVREMDLVGRYGGEELIILLPETDRRLSMQVAERLRASIAATPIQVAELAIPLTVSIGVATKDENTIHLETLIARADQAMYIAKHKGRNRVAMSK